MTFKNPTKPKDQKPSNVKKSPFNYSSPTYDNRGGNFVDAGTNYGVGFNVNVGHRGKTKTNVDVLPFGRIQTPRIDEIG